MNVTERMKSRTVSMKKKTLLVQKKMLKCHHKNFTKMSQSNLSHKKLKKRNFIIYKIFHMWVGGMILGLDPKAQYSVKSANAADLYEYGTKIMINLSKLHHFWSNNTVLFVACRCSCLLVINKCIKYINLHS